jgi:hypothetical protein
VLVPKELGCALANAGGSTTGGLLLLARVEGIQLRHAFHPGNTVNQL